MEVRTVARTGEVVGWGCLDGPWSDRGRAWLPDVARRTFAGQGGVPVDEEAAASIAGSAFGFRGLLAR